MHVCVKMMSKGSKEALTVLIVTHVTQVESGVFGFYATLHSEYCTVTQFLLMSKVSNTMYCTLYTVTSHPCQEGRLFI